MFFALWAAGVAAIGTAIYRFEFEDSNRVGTVIASVKTKQGGAQLRPEGRSLWMEVSDRQKFVEGDAVTTTSKAKLQIEMSGGRVLMVGPNSQLVLSSEGDGSGKGLGIVTLLRGNIAVKQETASGNAAAPAAIKVRSGNKVIALTGGKDEVEIARLPGQEVAVLGLKLAGQTLVKTTAAEKAQVLALVAQTKAIEAIEETPPEAGEAETITAESVKAEPLVLPTATPVPTETPTPTPTPIPTISAEGFEPTIDGVREGETRWAMRSLRDPGVGIAITVRPPRGKTMPKGWAPAVVLGNVSKPIARIELEREGRAGEYRGWIEGAAIFATRGRVVADGGMEWTVALTPGARVAQPTGKPGEVSWGQPMTFRVRSIHAVGKGAREMRLTRLRQETVQSWYSGADRPREGASLVTFTVADADDIVRAKEFIQGADGFTVGKASFDTAGEGIFLVRRQQVIARLKTAGTPAAEVKALARALGCDLVYFGEGDAFLGARTRGRESLVGALKAALEKDGAVYLAQSDRLVKFNKSFLATDASVIEFVDRNAAAVFVKPAKILYWGEAR